jgi:hemoglobin
MWHFGLGLVMVASLVLSGFGCASTPPDRTLYHRMGGLPTIRMTVDDFVLRVRADPRVSRFFEGSNIPLVKEHLTQLFCEVSGGPCTYLGADMKTAHAGMGLSDADFNAVAEDLGASLDAAKVAERERKELLSILAKMRRDIVEK